MRNTIPVGLHNSSSTLSYSKIVALIQTETSARVHQPLSTDTNHKLPKIFNNTEVNMVNITMVKCSRRWFMSIGTAMMTMGAGCTEDDDPGVQWDSGDMDIKITNGDDSPHDVSMSVEGDFSARERRKDGVEAGETAVFEDFVPKLDYDHRFDVEISVDGNRQLDETYRMDHDLDAYEFRIEEDGDVSEVEVEY